MGGNERMLNFLTLLTNEIAYDFSYKLFYVGDAACMNNCFYRIFDISAFIKKSQ